MKSQGLVAAASAVGLAAILFVLVYLAPVAALVPPAGRGVALPDGAPSPSMSADEGVAKTFWSHLVPNKSPQPTKPCGFRG